MHALFANARQAAEGLWEKYLVCTNIDIPQAGVRSHDASILAHTRM
jgi:hypothetical protein